MPGHHGFRVFNTWEVPLDEAKSIPSPLFYVFDSY